MVAGGGNPGGTPGIWRLGSGGLETVQLDEMVQVCMVKPMAAEPLPWERKELAALTAYMEEVRKQMAMNPCSAQNPCAAKLPAGSD